MLRLQGLYDVALDRANNAHRSQAELLQRQAQLQAALDTANGQIPAAQLTAQNRRPALLAVPHRGQFIPCRYLR